MDEQMLTKLEALREFLLTQKDILGVTRGEIMKVMDINGNDYRENYELIYDACLITHKERDE